MQFDQVLSEAEFLRLKNGDKTLFKRIFDQYFSLVKYVVMQCGISSDEAMDIVQEVFLRLRGHPGNNHSAQIGHSLRSRHQSPGLFSIRQPPCTGHRPHAAHPF